MCIPGARCAQAAKAIFFLGALALSACTADVPTGLPSPQPTLVPIQNTEPVQGEVMGSGETRVALLLPLSGEGNGAQVAAEMRNAAQLVLEDAGPGTLQVVVKDTGGTEAGASAAAASAVAERAALVLGPLFAANVRAAAPALQQQGTLMVAFSSDRSAAAPGVYLNSYQPEGLVERIVSYAAAQGLTEVAAMVPAGRAGDLAETAARGALQQAGGNLTAVARYDYDSASLQMAAQEAALAVGEADALLLPDGGSIPAAVAGALTAMGADLSGKRLLGTGQWASADLSDPALDGAWFADTDHARMQAFRARYQQRFGAEPSVTAALAYDTVILAATLARSGGAAAFTGANLEVPSGYTGYTGVFRFRPDGTTERGYAVYEVTDGAPRLISPAPGSFAGS